MGDVVSIDFTGSEIKRAVQDRVDEIHAKNIDRLKDVKDWCDRIMKHDASSTDTASINAAMSVSLGCIVAELNDIHEGRGAMRELGLIAENEENE